MRFFVAAHHCDGYTVRVILFPVVYYFSWISRLAVQQQHRIDDVHLKIEIPIYKINVDRDGPTIPPFIRTYTTRLPVCNT